MAGAWMPPVTLELILGLLGVGALVGLLSGFFGVGGGIVMIPILLVALRGLGLPRDVLVHLAFGTSLAVIVGTSPASAWAHHRTGNVQWRAVPALAGAGMVGGLLGATLAARIQGLVLRRLFGLLEIVAAAQMVLGKAGGAAIGHPRHSRRALLPAGLLFGAFSGFFGIGGGVVSIPVMVFVLNYPMHRAVGTSNAIMAFNAVAGTASYLVNGWRHTTLPALGYIYLPAWICLTLTSLPFAELGARLAQGFSGVSLRRAFAALAALVGVWLLVGA